MAEALYRLGRFCARRAWLVIVAWLVITGLAATGFLLGRGTLSSTVSIPGTETARVTEELATRLPAASGGMGTVVFHTDDGAPLDAEQREQISALLQDVTEVEGVRAVTDPFQTEKQVADAAAELDAGRAQLEAGRAELEQGAGQLDQAAEQVRGSRVLAEAGDVGPEVIAQLDAAQAEIDAQRTALNDGRRELAAQEAKLQAGADLLALSAPIRQVSQDESAALGVVLFTDEQLEVTPQTKEEVNALLAGADIPGVGVEASVDLTSGVPEVIGAGEIIGLLVAGLALQIMLGTALAAAVPIAGALVGVAVSVMLALAFSSSVEMTSFTPVLGLMIGLAVGIDYALFIVNRHRHQLREGVVMEESIGLAAGTAGNAVVFAGSTVLVALLALNVSGIGFLGLMGTVAALSVLTAVLVSITLTPALLRLLGERVLPKRLRGTPEPIDLVREPMTDRGAILRVVGATLVLLVIAIPAMSMRLGLPDGSSEPEESQAYRAFSITAEKFGGGVNGPLLVVADLPEPVTDDQLTLEQARIATALARTPDVVAVAPIGVSDDRELLAFQVLPAEGPNSESTTDVVNTLRNRSPLYDDVTLGVAGAASGNIDISSTLADALPRYLALVVGISLLIMLAVFRSVLVPIMATVGFVMSLFAAFGGVVAVFQWGWLGGIFGVHDPGPVLSFLPTFLIGVLFGLAMDYQLFLVTGMREAYIHGVPAQVAVRRGFNAARVVVAVAAIIMISVFAGFITSEVNVIRAMGFGLALGIALDAFIVRLLLIPGLMHLAGERAWWLPDWLDRLLPNVDVEGASLERTHPHPTHWDLEAAAAGAADRAGASAGR
ncbi:MAG: MMPL family transporter [Candidatus Nanopelagicales bacterium]